MGLTSIEKGVLQMIDMVGARIKKIFQDDAFCDDKGRDIVLDVDFDNGEKIFVSLDTKINEPLFIDVVMGRCGTPSTDGKCAYWKNGASLSIREMMLMQIPIPIVDDD